MLAAGGKARMGIGSHERVVPVDSFFKKCGSVVPRNKK